MMRRGLMLFVGAGLLSLLAGCRHSCHGRCDCLVYPIIHGTPSPIVQPASFAEPPLHPVAPAAAQ
ncbi:MAG TPA: hypothetical protein VMF69_01415 [Gemmataceae bacterium]|nr:hypothetical protein [Gemmataceae bacterium]